MDTHTPQQRRQLEQVRHGGVIEAADALDVSTARAHRLTVTCALLMGQPF